MEAQSKLAYSCIMKHGAAGTYNQRKIKNAFLNDTVVMAGGPVAQVAWKTSCCLAVVYVSSPPTMRIGDCGAEPQASSWVLQCKSETLAI